MVRWIVALAVIVLLLVISWLNLDQMLMVLSFTFWNYKIETPVIMALFAAFIVGAVVWFPFAIVQFIQSKSEIRTLRKENSRLQKELGDLRNISIEEEESRVEEDEK